ncbi:MAG: hypothetical protein DRO73_05225 [Candidatus Thorarchaeota archaeon]|nr:MAG: hypothetical protein DRO73_05225 [Candidatus Thorarchaeota archaeon]
MSDDMMTRLREKTMQIAALNQRIETLQVQLSGSVKRANKLSQQVHELEEVIEQKNAEIQSLREELRRMQGALQAMGQHVQDMRSDQPVVRASPGFAHDCSQLQTEIDKAHADIRELKGRIERLSAAAMDVVTGKEQAVDALKKALMEAGDPRFRILAIVLQKRRAKVEDLAAMLVADISAVMEAVDKLQAEGEVEVDQNGVVIPAKKYREAQVPVEKWQHSPPEQIFDELEKIVARAEGHENVSKALEAAVDILEQKLARGGALIFEMRRTANTWRSSQGDLEDLQYKIRQWKARAQALA